MKTQVEDIYRIIFRSGGGRVHVDTAKKKCT